MGETFLNAFGDEGNTAEIELDDWECSACGATLEFELRVDKWLSVDYVAECCDMLFIISPMYACYNREDKPK